MATESPGETGGFRLSGDGIEMLFCSGARNVEKRLCVCIRSKIP